MEESTTDADMQDTQALDAQPVEQPAEADNTLTSEPTQGEEEPDTSSDNSDEPESKTYTPEWLQSKGIDPNDPDALQKALNMAYNSEKLMSKSRQQSSALEKQVSQAPQVEGASLNRTDLLVGAMLFKQSNPLTEAQDSKMGEYLTSNPQKLQMLQHGLLTYEDIYQISGAAGMGQPDPDVLKSQGRKEALQQLANKQAAVAPRGNASAGTNTAAVDPILAELLAD